MGFIHDQNRMSIFAGGNDNDVSNGPSRRNEPRPVSRQETSAATPSGSLRNAEFGQLISERRGLEPELSQLGSVVERLEAVAVRLERLLSDSGRLNDLANISTELPADVEARRRALRPAHVRVLFVTTPIFPDDATNFYLADSHLYRCIRGAFIRALGPNVPQGEDFLWFFRDHGCWLYHAVPEPARGPGRPRSEWVRGAVLALAEVLDSSNPDYVVGLKARLRPRIVEAAERVRHQNQVIMLATPRALWDPQFIVSFQQMLGVVVDAVDEATGDHDMSLDLVEAVQRALLDRSNRRQRARDLVQFIEAGNYYRTGVSPLKKAQISIMIRSRRDIFDVNSAGVRVRDGGDARGRRVAPAAANRA